MSDLEPITREETLMNGDKIEPITREEMILAGEDIEPKTRREWFLKKYRGGGDVEVVTLHANENTTFVAPEGQAYSPVVVNVPQPTNKAVNPNYEWWANEDKTLVVRVQRFPAEINNNIHFRIYFNWFDINTATSPFQQIMQPPFVTLSTTAALSASPFYKNNCQVYAECDQTDYGGAADAHGYIGFYGGTIRGWAPGLATNQVGKYRAIMESTDSGQVANPTPWEEPTFDPING